MSYQEDEDEGTELDAGTQPPTELPTGTITITLQLDKYLSGGKLEDLIANNLSRQISSSLEKVIQKRVEETVLAAARGEFEKHAQKLTAEFFEKDFYKTNNYGQRSGEKISVVEMFGQMFREYLSQKVNTSGNEANYNDSIPRAVYFLRLLAIDPLNAAIKEQVGKVAATAKTQIQESVSRYIADQLMPKVPEAPQLKP